MSYLPNARPHATYAAMISYLDMTVGAIMDELEKAGKAENTLLIFTSDNGAVDKVGGADKEFFRSNGMLRAGKMSLYEGGIRMPFIARWPGRIPAGASSEHLFACYDALATLADVAGARKPKTDGISYLPALIGKEQQRHEYLYFEYPEASVMQAIVFEKYKAIRPNLKKEICPIEIYDLATDPGETKNIADSRPDLVRRAETIFAKEHRPNRDFPLGSIDAKPKPGA